MAQLPDNEKKGKKKGKDKDKKEEYPFLGKMEKNKVCCFLIMTCDYRLS